MCICTDWLSISMLPFQFLRFSFFRVSKFLVLFTIHNSEARRASYMELQNIILNMETDKVNPETDKVIANTSPSWLSQQQQICFRCKIESLFLIRLKQQLQQSEERSQIKRKERKGQQVVCLFRASSCRLNGNPSGHICQNYFELGLLP